MKNGISAADVQVITAITAVGFFILCAAIQFVLMRVTRLSHSRMVRIGAAVSIVVVAFSSPSLMDFTLQGMNRTSGTGRVMIDTGLIMKIAPGFAGTVVAYLLNVRYYPHVGRRLSHSDTKR